MPNPRVPVAKAHVTGAAVQHPGRHAERKEPTSRPLGKAPSFLSEFGIQAWEGFKAELPWLMESDRAVMEICAQVRGLLIAGEDVGVTKLSMYQSMLSKLGATPADRSRVNVADDDSGGDEFFGPN